MTKLLELLGSSNDGINLFLEEDLSSENYGVGGKDVALGLCPELFILTKQLEEAFSCQK